MSRSSWISTTPAHDVDNKTASSEEETDLRRDVRLDLLLLGLLTLEHRRGIARHILDDMQRRIATVDGGYARAVRAFTRDLEVGFGRVVQDGERVGGLGGLHARVLKVFCVALC